jgi:hypothetical protein
MIRLAHIVNPVLVGESSDLYLAQPITFESMRRAREYASGQLEVELLSAQYPEDAPLVPRDFLRTADLLESVQDHGWFQRPRKLPLLRDILNRLYEASDAEYLGYTNVDIGLLPHFYTSVASLVDAGYDAFVINRRTIPARYTEPSQLPLMYAEVGEPHRGWDCFIFRRDAYPHYRLGTVCLGAPRMGLALLANLIAYAEHFSEFKDQHLTFHLGNDRGWSGTAHADYAAHNTRQLLEVLAELEEEVGPFDQSSPPGGFLSRRRRYGPLYELWVRHVRLPVRARRWLERATTRRPATGGDSQ